ncbi:hypothetical protein CerSpe_247560 [Prunus speciosa]
MTLCEFLVTRSKVFPQLVPQVVERALGLPENNILYQGGATSANDSTQVLMPVPKSHIPGRFDGQRDKGIAQDGVSSIPTRDEGPIENSSDSVAIFIRQLILRTPNLRPECCIYRVPERFRKGNEEFYQPRLVGIGPYHIKDKSYVKPKYVDAFFRRNKLNLDDCLGLVRKWEAKARSYYVDHIELSSDDFTFIMLMDATFVLELMLRHRFSGYIDNCDPIFHKPRLIEDVYHDILLIENQLPFFVLEGLYLYKQLLCFPN